MQTEQPNVYVVDDEAGVRSSLGRLLRSAGWIPRGFATAREFLDAYDPDTPGCLVLDLAMPGMNGLELQRALRERGAELPIVFLTGQAEVPDSVDALKEGAFDFLIKPAEPEALVRTVRRALRQDAEDRLERDELDELRRRFENLTPREREVFAHVAAGKLNKQIARDLGAAEKTIRIHRGRVMKKMRADSLASLVRMADRLGIRA